MGYDASLFDARAISSLIEQDLQSRQPWHVGYYWLLIQGPAVWVAGFRVSDRWKKLSLTNASVVS